MVTVRLKSGFCNYGGRCHSVGDEFDVSKSYYERLKDRFDLVEKKTIRNVKPKKKVDDGDNTEPSNSDNGTQD